MFTRKHLSKIYRTSIENLSEIYRASIDNLSNIYRQSIEHLSNIYRKSIENLLNIYRTYIEPRSPQIHGGSGSRLAGNQIMMATGSPVAVQIHPRSAPDRPHIYRKSMEHLSSIFRQSIEHPFRAPAILPPTVLKQKKRKNSGGVGRFRGFGVGN